MIKIAIILGSTRPNRNGEAVAKWVCEVATKRSDAEFELVDIKDFNLPLLVHFAHVPMPVEALPRLCDALRGPRLLTRNNRPNCRLRKEIN